MTKTNINKRTEIRFNRAKEIVNQLRKDGCNDIYFQIKTLCKEGFSHEESEKYISLM